MEETPQTPQNNDQPVPQIPVQEKVEDKKDTPPAKAGKKISTRTIVWIVVIAVGILIPVIVYFAKESEISKLRDTQQKEIEKVKKEASDQIDLNNKENLETVAKVFSWAARSAMLRNNLDEVDLYMNELVKVKNFRQIVALDFNGKVVLSTDKKYEGTAYNKVISEEMMKSNEIKAIEQENGDLLVTAPVMGLDSRLGTIVITYNDPKASVEDNSGEKEE